MATVSEIKWYQTGEGKCSGCGRVRPIGRVNLPDDSSQTALCIDCHFGPPIEYWTPCPKCGSLEVNPEAYCYNCEQEAKNN